MLEGSSVTGKRKEMETECKAPPAPKRIDSKTAIALGSFAHFDPQSQHLERDPTSGTLTVKSPGTAEHYGWKFNDWRSNPLGFNFLPTKEEIEQKETGLFHIGADFFSFDRKNMKNEEQLTDLILCGENVIKHLQTAKISALLPFRQSSEIKDFNEKLGNWIKITGERLKEIRQDLSCLQKLIKANRSTYNKLWEVFSREDADTVFKAYSDRERGNLTLEEVRNIVKRYKSRCGEELQESLQTILDASNLKAPKYNWGVLFPPRNSSTSQDIKDCYRLEERLISFFPANGYHLNELEAEAGKPFEERPRPSAEEFQELCDNLMATAVRIGDAVCEDLKYWSENGGYNNATKFDLLKRQRDGGTYLFKAYFFLPRVYFRLATLNVFQSPPSRFMRDKFENPNVSLMPDDWHMKFFEPDTKQFEWRESYHNFRTKIMEITGGVLENADETRFNKLAPEHKEFGIGPIGTEPT